jgi:hypothetical protein
MVLFMLDRLREPRSLLFTVVGAAFGLLGSIWIHSYETIWDFMFGPMWPFFGMPFFSILIIILCTLVFGIIGYLASRL